MLIVINNYTIMRYNIKLRHKYYNPPPFSPNFTLDTNYLTFSEASIISKTDEYFPRNATYIWLIWSYLMIHANYGEKSRINYTSLEYHSGACLHRTSY